MATSRPTHLTNTDTCTFTLDLSPPNHTGDRLLSQCAQLNALCQQLTRGYIWHKQPRGITWQPAPTPHATSDRPSHQQLRGTLDVTDAVDDEWLAVWTLTRVSHHSPDAVISIDDDDGEFLLIEAADVLPNWLTPQNATNRVWIHRGRLHLVPLHHKSALPFPDQDPQQRLNPSFDPDEDSFLDRAAAIGLVRNPDVDTLAPKEVEDAVWARIEGYPAKMKEHEHRTLAYLPTDIALALSDSPGLIAEAVGAFYEREPATLRAVNTMSRFPPTDPSASPFSSTKAPSATGGAEPDPNATPASRSLLPGTVLVPTLLTRPLYSQLVLQRFYAPKVFEKAGWTRAVGKGAFSGSNDEGTEAQADERRRSVGMKIACGFEMLYRQTSGIPRSSSTDGALELDLDSVDTSTPAYKAYLATLRTQGFFARVADDAGRGGNDDEEQEVEGSERWRVLERQARESWVKAMQGQRPQPSFAQRVDEAVARARARLSATPRAALTNDSGSDTARPVSLWEQVLDPGSITPDAAERLEDSEDWMALDEQGLEDLLAAKGGASRSSKGAGAALGDSDLEESTEDDEDDEQDEEGGGGEMDGVETTGGGSGTGTTRRSAEDRKAQRAAHRLEEMAGKVEEFVQGRGAVNGALFEDERDMDDEGNDSADDEDEGDEDEDMPELSAEERAVRMEKLVAALPAEQWGQKNVPSRPLATASSSSAADASAGSSSAVSRQRDVRAPKLAKEVYEGASDLDDDESDSENEAMPGGEDGLGGGGGGGSDVDEGEDAPAVVNEEDVLDLGEEMDEFLKFATETLGLTEAQYEKILSDRRGRGAFVPGPAKEKKTNVIPASPSSTAAASSSSSSRVGGSASKISPAAATAAGNPPPAREPLRNPNLTDFDALMEQMETELAHARAQRRQDPAHGMGSGRRGPDEAAEEEAGPAPTGKYASRQSRDPHRIFVDSLSDEDSELGDGDDDLAAMDAELAALLQQGGTSGPSSTADGSTSSLDYNLVKNFLESFQSQGGFAGPAGTLAGRLGFPLPRDAAE